MTPAFPGTSALPGSRSPTWVVGDPNRAEVCVCILNWNGWRDTIECLESVLRIDTPPIRVVVIDNGSTDDSLVRIREWAEGRSAVALDTPTSLRPLVMPPVRKPIALREVGRAELEDLPPGLAVQERILLVRNEANLGFARGLNVGIRYATRSEAFGYVWLLNNDTVVHPDALRHLVERMRADHRIGLCGSTLLFYDAPDRVQALGGFRYNRWLGLPSQIGQMTLHEELTSERAALAEREMFGVQGASVLVSDAMLRSVGPMSEEFFLYFEEQDWAVRARRAGFRVGYAPGSTVYHKEGRSTGNNSLRRSTRSAESDFFQIQSRLLFTRRHFPLALPTVYGGLVGVVVNRLRRRQFRRVATIARLALRVAVTPVALTPSGEPPVSLSHRARSESTGRS